MLAGQAFGALQPFPDGCLRNFADGGECGCEPAISTACINASKGVVLNSWLLATAKVLNQSTGKRLMHPQRKL
jgi:hypothetical protein